MNVTDSTGTWLARTPIHQPITTSTHQQRNPATSHGSRAARLLYVNTMNKIPHIQRKKIREITQTKKHSNTRESKTVQVRVHAMLNGYYLQKTGTQLGHRVNVSTTKAKPIVCSLDISKEQLQMIKKVQSRTNHILPIIDSGSTIHCIRDKRFFKTLRALHTPLSVLDAGSHEHTATHTGTVSAMVQTTIGIKQIILHNVYLIETFEFDIISVKQLQKNGFGVYFPPTNQNVHHGYTITPTQHTVQHTVSKKTGLDHLTMRLQTAEDTIPTTPRVFANAQALTATPTSTRGVAATHDATSVDKSFTEWLNNANKQHLLDRLAKPIITDGKGRQTAISGRLADLGIYALPKTEIAHSKYLNLHHKLGHCSPAAVMQYARENMSPQEVAAMGSAYLRLCQYCELAKARRKPVPKKRKDPTITTVPWQYQSMDIVGRMDYSSITSKYKYALVIIDHHTSFVRTYGMKSTKEIPAALEEHFSWISSTFPKHAEKMTAYNMRRPIKSDDHNVLKTKEANAVYAKAGVIHITSPAHTQGRNGKVEAAIGRLKAAAATLRAAQGLDPQYWWLALRHSAHVSNILPKKINDGKSPHFMVYGHKPNMEHLHGFGSTAYMKRSKHKEGEHKGMKGIYVGWYPSSQTHLILIPSTHDGNPSLKQFQTHQPGALPSRKAQHLFETFHIKVDDKLLPPAVQDGTVPLYQKGSFIYDDEEEEETEVEEENVNSEDDEHDPNDDAHSSADEYDPHEYAQDVDRTDIEVIDLDYHNTHCITQRSECTCVINESKPLERPNVNICTPLTKHIDNATCDEGLLNPYPRVMAIKDIHPNWTSAKETEYAHLFDAARKSEEEQMQAQGVMTKIRQNLVPRGEKLHPSSMLFTLKGDAQNNIERAKARWVLGGHRSIEGVHYQEVEANCPRWSTLRMLLARAAKDNKKIRSCDIPGAYLFAPGSCTIYMRSPHDQVSYDKDGTPFVYKLTGNLYGRKDAGRQWMNYFTEYLSTIGFVANKSDPCMFERTRVIDGKTQHIAMVCYVDDLCYFGTDEEATTMFEQELTAKFGNVKQTNPDLFLGCNFNQDDTKIHISNEAMIKRMRDKFLGTKADVRKTTTPFPSHGSALGAKVIHADSPKEGDPPIQHPYRELVGALSYMSMTTRPDIAYFTSQLAKVQANPGIKHWKLAKYVLKYCITTMSHGITYQAKGRQLEYYVDASWADVEPNYIMKGKEKYLDPDDKDARRSSYGYVGIYASGPISWAARVHKGRRALSTMESELIAATEAGKDIVHIRQLMSDMNIEHTHATPLYEDNQSTINSILRKGITQRTKHIEVRFFYLRDLQEENVISITKMHTSEQIADVYTKRLAADAYGKLRDQLVHPPQQQEFIGFMFIRQVESAAYVRIRNEIVTT